MAKKIAIMQPYFFPYLGYFQMIAAADVFVLYDDIQFISRGWINRNKILINGDGMFITLPVKNDNHTLKIHERYFSDDFPREIEKILRGIYLSYARAPYFREVFPVLESIIKFPQQNVSLYIENSIRTICNYLDISTEILVSSRLGIGNDLHGKQRVLKIIKELGGGISINPIGGVDLYSCEEFLQHGVTLKFIKMHDICYRQYGNRFVPRLSIIDVLMFNKIPEVHQKLLRYSLEDNCGNPVYDVLN
ncbi:hypothetical protein D3870_07215 [Noviherbaspirillum cavernae]|uniref:Glycine transferase n=1 Tax=Noviherbaspirillum cavernae TaxID=2320862 RepID=A0A418X0J1_9BURK|nr:WbqC family protein [Noviherbaspirillum cavernae]RJG05835.1 hypothetical protein D3870_07215 [Noviherbaspirillum cavernae]